MVFFFVSSCDHTSDMQSLTQSQTIYTHALAAWLLGAMTPVGVLCFRNDSKDSLKTAERGAEWEHGKCKKIVLNEICQFGVSSQIIRAIRTPAGVKCLHLMCFFNLLRPRKVHILAF